MKAINRFGDAMTSLSNSTLFIPFRVLIVGARTLLTINQTIGTRGGCRTGRAGWGC